jgi:hypothetical protein
MNLLTQLQGLVGKQVTVSLIGSSTECAGSLVTVGSDYIDVVVGGTSSANPPHWLIPIVSISCVAHRP